MSITIDTLPQIPTPTTNTHMLQQHQHNQQQTTTTTPTTTQTPATITTPKDEQNTTNNNSTTPNKHHHHYTSSGGAANGLLSVATLTTNSFMMNNTPCTPSVVSSVTTLSKSQSNGNLGMSTAIGGTGNNVGVMAVGNNGQTPPTNAPQMNLCGFLLKNRWKIQGLLGQGSFGSIYSAHDLVTSEEVAIKIEKVQSTSNQPQNGQPVTPQASSLKVEVCALKNLQNCRYVVTYIHSGRQYITYGSENVALNFLVMERLGENLAELRRKNVNGVFNLATTMRCGVQMIDCIEEIHRSGFLHRDVKPANFVTGRTRNARGRIFVIDFGLARAYKHEDGNLKPPRSSCGFRGTPRYASINAHNGLELSRRDDLWSIFYVMIEMASGNLPWRRMRDKAVIGKLKEQHTIQNSSELLKGLPQQFVTMLNYLKTLKFETEPDYTQLKNICKSYFAPHKEAMETRTYEECQFEWIVKNSDENANTSMENANTSTTNPDRTDSKSRTGKLSTSVFFGSTRLSTVSNANLGSNALVGSQQEFSKSLPDMSKKRGNKGDDDDQRDDREGKQPHCKCSIM